MNKKPEIKIVILQRGWVFVGEFNKEGQDCTLSDSYNIRTWGTSNGLGELIDGPLPKTILDRSGTVHFNEMTSIAMIDCDSDWLQKVKLKMLNK